MSQLLVTPQGPQGRLADRLMSPFMYLAQGTIWELPQRTHRWNRHTLTAHERSLLSDDLLLRCEGDPAACSRWWLGFIPRFHLPILGGWRRYVVLAPSEMVGETEPREPITWFLGWVTETGLAQVSRIPLTTPVRALIGPETTRFFAITAAGQQRVLYQHGAADIGRSSCFGQLPLL